MAKSKPKGQGSFGPVHTSKPRGKGPAKPGTKAPMGHRSTGKRPNPVGGSMKGC